MLEPEPSKITEDDDTNPRWKPFKRIKKILQRRNSRSNSPTTEYALFTSGCITHAHSRANPFEDPNKYLLISMSPRGTLLPISKDQKNCLGYIVCECRPKYQFTSYPKRIVFVPQANAGDTGHFINSPFVFPDLTTAQLATAKSYPLFYRLPAVHQHITSLQEINTEQLISDVLAELTNLTEPINKVDIDHVYQSLFHVGPSAPTPLTTTSTPQSSAESLSEPEVDLDNYLDNISQGGEEHLQQTQPSVRDNIGVLIYKHRYKHRTTWGPLSTAEMDEIVHYVLKVPTNAYTSDKLESIAQEDIREKLMSKLNHKSFKRDTAGIFLQGRETSVQSYAIPLDRMAIIQGDLIYASTKSSRCTYTLAREHKVILNARKLALLTAPEISSWFENLKQTIINNRLFYLCSECPQSFPKASKLQVHKEQFHNKRSTQKRNKDHYQASPGSTRRHLSSSSEDSQDDQRGVNSGNTQKNKSLNEGILQKQIYQPTIIDQLDCPPAYITFWNLRAFTRRISKKDKPMSRFVAPKFPINMLELEKEVNYPGMLSDEYTSYAKAYQNLASQKDYASVDQYSQFQVGVINSAHDLAVLGKLQIFNDLQKQAPQLETKTLSTLTEAALQAFFFQARCYMLTSSIPWDSFPEFFLTTAALGPDILTRVNNALLGYPTHRKVLRTLSTFIERIIRTLLPAQESYNDAEARIIEEHKAHLLGPSPNIDHTRTMLQSDSRDLVTKSPYYKQVQNEIPDESKRLMIEAEKTNLLHKIIANTVYEAKLYKLLIASDSYTTINTVPYNVLLDHLQNLIIADKKSEVALVHANRLSRTSRSTLRSSMRSPTQRSLSSKSRQRRERDTRDTQRRSTSRSPKPTHSRQQSPRYLQEKCDLCLKMSYPKDFCIQNKHCRRDGHQSMFRDSKTFQQRVDRNEKDLFTTHEQCTKCNPYKNRPTQWLHGATSSQVMIPPNYFQHPPIQTSQLGPAPFGHYIQQQQPQSYNQFAYPSYGPQQYQHPPPNNSRGRQSPSYREQRNRSPYGQNRAHDTQGPQQKSQR